jgi:hypothetical protein
MSSLVESFYSRLLGTWNLISFTATSTRDPNNLVHPLGENCRGRAIYSPDGYASTYIQSKDLQLSSDGRTSQSSSELAEVAKKTISYSGRFRLELDKVQPLTRATVYYDVEMSIPTSWIGKTEIRELEMIEVDGETQLWFRNPGSKDSQGFDRDILVKTVRASSRTRSNGRL